MYGLRGGSARVNFQDIGPRGRRPAISRLCIASNLGHKPVEANRVNGPQLMHAPVVFIKLVNTC